MQRAQPHPGAEFQRRPLGRIHVGLGHREQAALFLLQYAVMRFIGVRRRRARIPPLAGSAVER
jgi:hypothetical protein